MIYFGSYNMMVLFYEFLSQLIFDFNTYSQRRKEHYLFITINLLSTSEITRIKCDN